MCVFLLMCMYVLTHLYMHVYMHVRQCLAVPIGPQCVFNQNVAGFSRFLEIWFLLVTNKKEWEYNALAAAHSYRIYTQLCVHTYSMQFIHTYDTKSRQHTYADTSVYIDTNTHNTYTSAAAAQFPVGLYSLPQSPFDLTLFCIILDIFCVLLITFNANCNNIATRRDFHAEATSGISTRHEISIVVYR